MQMLESMTTNSQIYFTDLEKDKNAKIGIAALVGKLSPKPQSHKSGWAFKLANQLTAAGYTDVTVVTDVVTHWEQNFNVMLLEHGMEYLGQRNRIRANLSLQPQNTLTAAQPETSLLK